jgi:DtxR family Mn-dependent transcriptional regulator
MKKKTLEDYLEIIYILQQKTGEVRTNDVAEGFGINPASVTEFFHKLHQEGYITYKKYSGVKLTKKGKAIAIATKKKHDTLKNFFTILGINETCAEKDACLIEHVVTPQTMDRLTKFVEFVQYTDRTPQWLDRFKRYYETGKYTSSRGNVVSKQK